MPPCGVVQPGFGAAKLGFGGVINRLGGTPFRMGGVNIYFFALKAVGCGALKGIMDVNQRIL
jgi:hypothetical protein